MITFSVPGAPQGKGRVPLEAVRDALDCDVATGILRWRRDCGQRARAGGIAGNLNANGYWVVGVARFRNIPAHRVVWALTHGQWPELEIDHIDGNRLNNAPVNLRMVTTGENHQNMRVARSDSSTGVLGVSRSGNRYRAQIQVGGRKHWLGEHDTIDAARAAYVAAKRKFHPKGTL